MKKYSLIVLGLGGATGAALLMAALIAVFVVRVAKPPVPVQVLYRESFVGEGYVAQITNRTAKHVAVKAHFSNRTLNESFQTTVDLPPRATREIGWMEGWKVRSGDDVMISMAEHRTLSTRIP
jgi:hypothetical protein